MIRGLVLGLVVGLGLGLWGGVDMGRERPLWSNPLENPSVSKRLQSAGDAAREQGAKALKAGERAAKEQVGELSALPEEGACDVCNLEFGLEQDHVVEVSFRIHPSIREVERVFYCSSEAASKLHIRVQTRVEPGAEKSVRPVLGAGNYRVRFLEDGSQQRALTVTTDGTVLAFARSGRLVRRSTDKGTTWSLAKEVGSDAGGSAVVDENTGDVMVVRAKGGYLWRSSDQGQTWKREEIKIKPNPMGHGALVVAAGVATFDGETLEIMGDAPEDFVVPEAVWRHAAVPVTGLWKRKYPDFDYYLVVEQVGAARDLDDARRVIAAARWLRLGQVIGVAGLIASKSLGIVMLVVTLVVGFTVTVVLAHRLEALERSVCLRQRCRNPYFFPRHCGRVGISSTLRDMDRSLLVRLW